MAGTAPTERQTLSNERAAAAPSRMAAPDVPASRAVGGDLAASLREAGLGQVAARIEHGQAGRPSAHNEPPREAGSSSSVSEILVRAPQVEAGGSGSHRNVMARLATIDDELASKTESLRMFEKITRDDPLGRACVAGPIRSLEAERQALLTERAARIKELREHEARLVAQTDRIERELEQLRSTGDDD